MEPKRVIIIGAVALGPKVACRLKRFRPDLEVTMVDQDEYISYGGCGIPYYISGDLSDVKELMSTSFHMLRDPEFFEGAKDVRVKIRTRALAIDRDHKQVGCSTCQPAKRKTCLTTSWCWPRAAGPIVSPCPGWICPKSCAFRIYAPPWPSGIGSPGGKWTGPSSSAPAPSASRWRRP